jgi:galactokinase
LTSPFNQAAVLEAHRQHFGEPEHLFRAPARVNIIGEHTDYNDGFVMPANADLYTWLAITRRDDRVVRLFTLNFDELVELSLDNLEATPGGGWQEYARGVLQVLQLDGVRLSGADILIAGEVPLRSGLSSSAAMETVIGLAMLACAGHDIDRARLAMLCQKAENEFVGVSCGIMDQFVVATCPKDHAIKLDCRSLESESERLPTNADFLIVHSGVDRQLGDNNYNQRRRECEQAVASLGDAFPGVTALRDVSVKQLESVRDSMDSTLYRRAHHVVTENDRVGAAFKAMREHDLRALGRALNASHASLRDDFEISCKPLDDLVDIATGCEGVYGSRMMGGGFGGCTISIVDPQQTAGVVSRIGAAYRAMHGRVPWHHVLGPTDPVTELSL